MKKHIRNLNELQIKAVQHESGPCMVLAGPGTGKTTIITSRVCNLLEEAIVQPENILVVTFSKAAAEEMKYRFKKLAADCNLKSYEKVSFGTFHSIFFRILKQYDGYKLDNLIDEVQKFNIIKAIIRKLELDFFDEEDQIAEIINDIGYFLNTMADIQYYSPSSCHKTQFQAILESYINHKQKANKFDYDDMLIDCYYLLRNNPTVLKAVKDKYKYILIDEFQDINKVQYETVKLFSAPADNVFIVGDDDQSIYGFRGADPEIMQYFEKEHKNCKKIVLKYNYRTTHKILSCASAIIDNNTYRYKKNLEAYGLEGDNPIVAYPEDFELEAKNIISIIKNKQQQGYSYSDMAVIFRTNIQSRSLVDAFMDSNIPFAAVDGAASIYNHWIFKDILSYMRLSININSSNDVIRIINKPKRFISRLSLEKAAAYNSNNRSILDRLIMECGLNHLQIAALEELKLNISRVGNMTPSKAVRHIRAVIGYDDYILEYASSKGISTSGLFEILDEVESSALNYTQLDQFILHIKEIEEKLTVKSNSYTRENKVQLLTMHRAKGLEYPIVFICGIVEGLSPCIKDKKENQKSIEEERRLFYVAMTRAKKELYIYAPKIRYKKKVEKSRFLDELYDIKKFCNENFYIGQKIFHKIFHEGVICKINNKEENKRAIVDFNGNKRELDMVTCIKNNIIKLM